jgi:4-hydroxy-tetrahydrodipicolinate synthase
MDNTREIIKLLKPEYPDFEIYSGFDDNFAHNVLAGGDGCIGGLSNLVPEICHAWVRAFEDNNINDVTAIQKRIDKLMDIYQVGKPFVPYIKKAMGIRGIPVKDYCTFPLPRASEEEELRLKDIMMQENLI